jgi:hypothetical protein
LPFSLSAGRIAHARGVIGENHQKRQGAILIKYQDQSSLGMTKDLSDIKRRVYLYGRLPRGANLR